MLPAPVFAHGLVGRADLPIPEALFAGAAALVLVLSFAVLYVAMPVDAIPDFVPIIGWLDDVGVMGAVGWFFMREINAHRRAANTTVDGLPRDEQSDAPKL